MKRIGSMCLGGVVVLIACIAASDEREEQSKNAAVTEAQVCQRAQNPVSLPRELAETSGLARSDRTPGLLWTHNDGNRTELFGIQSTAVSRRVKVTGVELDDWEDLAAGPCAAGHCLYLADIGDNEGKRRSITFYEVTEPAANEQAIAAAASLRARYPEGAQNAEALFRLGSDLYVITKGTHGPIRLYRYAAPFQPGKEVPLQLVKQLAGRPRSRSDLVTGATTSPNQQWVAVRTYQTLAIYRARDLIGATATEPVLRFDLGTLREPQGESVLLEDDGTVWLTTEAESSQQEPMANRLSCELPRD